MYREYNFGTSTARSYAEAAEKLFDPKQSFYLEPAAFKEDAFQIFGNLYYVGDKKVCSHLVDTGDGLILFDTGYGHTMDMMLDSIRSLGFHPEDIRFIIHSHGHFDHMGSGEDFRRRYGCKIFMSKVDTEYLRIKPELALMQCGPVPDAQICWPDVEIEDGQHISLGNTDIRCVLTPGHTMGTMSFFFDAVDGDKRLHVGYFGGVGLLTIYKDYCEKMSLPLDKSVRLRESIQKIWPEPVDIVLGNHPSQNCTLEKRQWMIEHPNTNPFINPEAWHIFLSALNERSLEFERLGL